MKYQTKVKYKEGVGTFRIRGKKVCSELRNLRSPQDFLEILRGERGRRIYSGEKIREELKESSGFR